MVLFHAVNIIADRLLTLVRAAGYSELSEFARAAGVLPGTATQQKNRGSIPYESAQRYVRTAQGTGATIEWLLDGRGDPPRMLERIPLSVPNGTPGGNNSVISTERKDGQIDAPPARGQSPGTSSAERLGTGRIVGDVREDTVEFRWQPGKLPVYAATDMGGGIVSISEKPSANDALPRFAWDIPGVFGIFTVTEEMSPAYERGDRPLVNPSKPVREGDDVLFLTGEVGKGGTPRAALRRLVGITPTHWRVKQWNPPKIEKFDRREWPVAFRVESKRNR